MYFIKIVFKTLLGAAAVILLAASLHLLFLLLLNNADTPPQPSDLVVVFPGEPNRITAGIDLVADGVAPRLAVVNMTAEQIKKRADKKVSPRQVEYINGGRSRSTFEDAHIAKQILAEHAFESVTLVTSSYHMPRALFLLKMDLLGSKVETDIHHYSIARPADSSFLTHFALVYNETMKIWGSALELIGNKLTDKLMYDRPEFQKISELAHRYLLINE